MFTMWAHMTAELMKTNARDAAAQVAGSKQRKEHTFQIEPSKIVDSGLIKAIFDPWQRSLFSRQ